MKSKMKDAILSERNLISVNTTIKGDIISEGDFRIDGNLEGNIETKGKVVIGKKGKITGGSITCVNAEIEGSASGKFHISQMLTLKNTAIVEGDVNISKLTVEPGAIFNVKCNMKGDNSYSKDRV